MIEGLKVTILGPELRDIATARADHHDERMRVYADQIESMQANQIEGMQYTNGDPIRALKERQATHENESRELRFIAAHIDLAESYLLDRDALRRLGIVTDRY
jgi:hypothetical protein